MSSQRPVYIPRKRKVSQTSHEKSADISVSKSQRRGEDYQTRRQFQKQQQPRFHGAFTGGFSAGYFNTVGTKEGWKPSLVKKREQKLEDFMDDEDHADWGGPTRLGDEYGTKRVAAPTDDPWDPAEGKIANGKPFLPVQSMLEVTHQTVGPRLLRRLGWREGGSAIVPETATTSGKGVENEGGNTTTTTLEQLARVHLSKRKLRKIRLQSSRISLPPPKLDKCGLGFEPYKDAPEFQRYRERRKQQAKNRASYNSSVNVYRLSDVAAQQSCNDRDHSNGLASKKHSPHDGGGEYLSYETAEDFVGKRSAAGFALRDDEDDAYDDGGGNNSGGRQSTGPKGFRVGEEEYNTEVYEHESSDEDVYDRGASSSLSSLKTPTNSVSGAGVDDTTSESKSVDVGNIFASWAGTDQPTSGAGASSVPRAALTSDGKPPLAGFLLGDSMDINQKRYPGPEIPRDCIIQRHKFGEHENPYVLEAISNAVKLEQKEERRSQLFRQQEESQRQRVRPTLDPSGSRPLSSNFSTLAEAMKNRFTSSTEDRSTKEKTTVETPTALPAGLHMPIPVENKEDRSEMNPTVAEHNPMARPNIKITRTTQSFFPNPLVCKRFRVAVPSNAKQNTGVIATDETKNNESVYFQKEILEKAKQLRKTAQGRPQHDIDSAQKPRETPPAEEKQKGGIHRPSIESLRKIFQASSDESSFSDEDDGSVEDSGDPTIDLLDRSSSENNARNRKDDDTAVTNQKLDLLGSERETGPFVSRKKEQEEFSSRSGDSDDDESSRRASSSSRKRRKERRHRRKHRTKDKRKHSRSKDTSSTTRAYYYSDASSSSREEDERRREKRYRDHKKKKKKKSSTSRHHKSRKREKKTENNR